MNVTALEQIKDFLASTKHIVIIQADNPDADSLGSSLALEELLSEMGKNVMLFCASDIPSYLHYLQGWDRVSNYLPSNFDASIFVDVSTYTLLEKLTETGQIKRIVSKPSLVLDHHQSVENPLDFERIEVIDSQASSTCELIYNLAKLLHRPLSMNAMLALMTGILGDTQGLTNDLASAHTYRAMADFIDQGASRTLLEERRKEASKMLPEIYKYKAQLISRTEFIDGGSIASVTIPQDEITLFSPIYNPAPLIQGDMLSVKGVAVVIVFKNYDDGRITGSIRSNAGYPIADKLAVKFGGGGHPFASGFKILNGRPLNEVKSECYAYASSLIKQIEQEHSNETLQYTYTIN